MKGISTVIAALLLLVITIGLTGVAGWYLFGLFAQKTGVVLELDQEASYCSGSSISLYIRNIGTDDVSANKLYVKVGSGTAQNCSSSGTIGAGGAPFECAAVSSGVAQGANQVLVIGSGVATNSVRRTIYCATG